MWLLDEEGEKRETYSMTLKSGKASTLPVRGTFLLQQINTLVVEYVNDMKVVEIKRAQAARTAVEADRRYCSPNKVAQPAPFPRVRGPKLKLPNLTSMSST